jgi:hypothetical protein
MATKMSSSPIFFAYYLQLIDSKLLRSHQKIVEINVCLNFLVYDERIQIRSRIWIRTNNYASESGRLNNLRIRIWNTACKDMIICEVLTFSRT